MPSADLVSEILTLLREMDGKGRPVMPETRILVDLDFDSLQMLELIETIKARYGVDLFMPPHTLDALRTPMTLAAALTQVQPATRNAPTAAPQSP
jgi:acyl carrier protein